MGGNSNAFPKDNVIVTISGAAQMYRATLVP